MAPATPPPPAAASPPPAPKKRKRSANADAASPTPAAKKISREPRWVTCRIGCGMRWRLAEDGAQKREKHEQGCTDSSGSRRKGKGWSRREMERKLEGRSEDKRLREWEELMGIAPSTAAGAAVEEEGGGAVQAVEEKAEVKEELDSAAAPVVKVEDEGKEEREMAVEDPFKQA